MAGSALASFEESPAHNALLVFLHSRTRRRTECATRTPPSPWFTLCVANGPLPPLTLASLVQFFIGVSGQLKVWAGVITYNVSSQDVRDGILDGSVMIYNVIHDKYYNATGTIGDQRYA